MRMIFCIGIICIILTLPLMAVVNNFVAPLPELPKTQDVLPALIWNPYHIASGDSILSSLTSAGYEAFQTDSLRLYFDSLNNYDLFVMGGVYEDGEPMIVAPYYWTYQATVDTFLEHGGRCYWEGAWSLGLSCYLGDTLVTDSLLWNYFMSVTMGTITYPFSYIKGLPGTYFEDIDSLGCERSTTDEIMGVWPGGNADPLVAPESQGATSKSAICVYRSSRTMCANFSWSRLHDRYSNTRRDLIIDVMNWLSGSAQNTPPEPIPFEFSLSQNYPNPFNASTTIKYDLPKASDVSIDIFDILGRKVETLVSEKQSAGEHSVIWDAQNATSGVYFYKIKAGDFADTKRCLLLK